MNAKPFNLKCVLAILLVAIPLASCSTSSQPETPTDVAVLTPIIESTPTGELEVLPTPVPEESTDAVATATSAPEAPTLESTESEATVPAVDPNWVQESYGDAWTIGYPAGWTINAAGANEGALQLEGDLEGHSYAVTYSYPIGILAESLEAWTDEMLLPLTLEQREAVVVSDLTVANTPAKKVLNFPSSDGTSIAHHVYIWKSEAKNPRLITITQTDGEPLDAEAMDQLLDQLIAAVQ